MNKYNNKHLKKRYDYALVFDDNSLYINDEEIKQKERKEIIINKFFNKRIQNIVKCPFCSYKLFKAKYENKFPKNIPNFLNLDYTQFGYLWYCSNCAFWQFYWHEFIYDKFPSEEFWNMAISKLKSFSNIPDCCNSEIAQYIRRNPSVWNNISPYKLENLVKDIFKANYSDCEVIHVGGPHDGGVDVIFIDSEDEEWLIQVKRRSSTNYTEGVSSLRNLLGTLIIHDRTKGILVSTADHFSYRAYKMVNRAREFGYIVELIDKGKLNRMIQPFITNRPWLDYLETNLKDITKHFNFNISN